MRPRAELPVEKRVVAVRALRGGRFEAVAPVLEKVLSTHPPAEVEAAAVDSLAAFDEPAAGSMILNNWRSYSPEARKHAVAAMLAQKNRVPLLLDGDRTRASGALGRGCQRSRALVREPGCRRSRRRRGSFSRALTAVEIAVIASYREALNLKGDVGARKESPSKITAPSVTCRGGRAGESVPTCRESTTRRKKNC